MHSDVIQLAIFAFLYSIFAGRVERSLISGPMVFVFAGVIMGPLVLGWFSGESLGAQLRFFADMTLTLILFSDAAKVNLRALWSRIAIPARMLLIGLPGAIGLGFLSALALFDVLSVFEAAVLGTMLAATDADLGEVVVTDPRLPEWLRAGLNAESGLNDGLSVPFLFIFTALALEAAGQTDTTLAPLVVVAREVGVGLVVGISLSLAGCWLLRICLTRGWVTDIWQQVTVPALALACFSLADHFDGSGYIAAFCGGMVFGHFLDHDKHRFVLAAEGVGEALAMLTWLLCGATIVTGVIGLITWDVALYAILSLTFVRMGPVMASLIGTHATIKERLFLGWFGPRGLASIVFVVIVLDSGLPNADFISLVVITTVMLSLILHGFTAHPLTTWLTKSQTTD